MATAVNAFANLAGLLLFGWFRWVGPWAAVAGAAVLVAVLALLAIKYLSNQAAIRRSRNRLVARVIEIVLYRENILGVFGNGGRILASFGPYLWHNVRPLLILAAPMTLLIIQIAAWLQWHPAYPGEPLVLTTQLDPAHPVLDTPLALHPSPGLLIDSNPVRVPDRNLASWRVRAHDTGTQWVDIEIDGHQIRKKISAAAGLDALSPVRLRGAPWKSMLYPAEPVLPAAAPLDRVEVAYPSRSLALGRHRVHWLVAFLVMTLAAGIALRSPLDVEI